MELPPPLRPRRQKARVRISFTHPATRHTAFSPPPARSPPTIFTSRWRWWCWWYDTLPYELGHPRRETVEILALPSVPRQGARKHSPRGDDGRGVETHHERDVPVRFALSLSLAVHGVDDVGKGAGHTVVQVRYRLAVGIGSKISACRTLTIRRRGIHDEGEEAIAQLSGRERLRVREAGAVAEPLAETGLAPDVDAEAVRRLHLLDPGRQRLEAAVEAGGVDDQVVGLGGGRE